MIFIFWMLSFKPTFSLSFTHIKRLFSSSSLSAIKMVSSAYLRLLIFLLAILIPFSLAFCMMYSAYKLNKQGDNILPWPTPSPFLNQFVVPCLVLTVASWPIIERINESKSRFFERKLCISIKLHLNMWQIRLQQESKWFTQSKIIPGWLEKDNVHYYKGMR